MTTTTANLQRIADVAAAMGKSDWVETLRAAADELGGRQVVTGTELRELREKAAMWDSIETLWILGDVHLTQEDNGGWGVHLEGVECADLSVRGNDPYAALAEVGKSLAGAPT